MKKAYHQKHPQDAHAQTFSHDPKESVRINKHLADSGFCSRRAADKLVMAERVTIDGMPAMMGSHVLPGQTVLVDNKPLSKAPEPVYIALNKPIGVTCTLDSQKANNIADFMDYKERIFPIGRLDKDSSGLILLTNDGDIVNKILRAENNHEKEYIVQVDKALTSAFLQKMGAGVEITNMRTKLRQVTKPCVVERLYSHSFKIILTQGLNRQIRRMCTELGYRVATLQRVRIMNIELGDLAVGHWRYITQEELTLLADRMQSV